MDILEFQEISWPNNGNLKKENITIFYSRPNNGKHENGVGFMIHRICYVRITGKIFNLRLIIIKCYAPTEKKIMTSKTTFTKI